MVDFTPETQRFVIDDATGGWRKNFISYITFISFKYCFMEQIHLLALVAHVFAETDGFHLGIALVAEGTILSDRN